MARKYDPDTKAEICDSIISSLEDGKGLATVCRELDFPRVTFLNWVDADSGLADRYARARARAADVIFEEILGIADDGVADTSIDPETGREIVNHDHIQRSKLRVDARKWVLAKMLPKKYGDSLSLDHSGTVKNSDEIDYSKYSAEELATMRSLIAKGQAPDNPNA